MIALKDILYKVTLNAVVGNTSINIHAVNFDSRKVENNHLFVAIRGLVADVMITLDDSVTYVEVDNSNKALAIIASNFYENPSENLRLVGVTGTNGKTTVTSLLYQLFKKAGYKVGLLSTVKIMVDEIEYKATHTTPDSLTINKYLSEMNAEGVEFCFMEVSSHGIHQYRTKGLHFEGGIFTNLSHVLFLPILHTII